LRAPRTRVSSLRYKVEQGMAATVLTRDGISGAAPVEIRRRIGAAAIDWTICVVAYLVLSIPLGLLEGFGFVLRSESSTAAPGRVVTILAQLAVLLPTLLYFTLGLREGRTLGMAAFDFKTLDGHDGKPPGTVRSVLRSLLSVVFGVGVYLAYMGHSAERTGWSHNDMAIYVLALVLTGIVVVDKAFVPVHRSGRSLTDRLFRLVRVTGAAADTDRGLSDWLDRRVGR
jgi:RDD family